MVERRSSHQDRPFPHWPLKVHGLQFLENSPRPCPSSYYRRIQSLRYTQERSKGFDRDHRKKVRYVQNSTNQPGAPMKVLCRKCFAVYVDMPVSTQVCCSPCCLDIVKTFRAGGFDFKNPLLYSGKVDLTDDEIVEAFVLAQLISTVSTPRRT